LRRVSRDDETEIVSLLKKGFGESAVRIDETA